MSLAIAAALAVAIMSIACVPTAMAAEDGSGCAYLYDNGVSSSNATTDWKFYVGAPAYLGLDQDFLNITVYGWMVNNTGTATGGDYTVTVYIDDGVTNVTKASTLVMVSTSISHVYGNISISAAEFAALTTNSSGVYYVTLTYSAVVVDEFRQTIVIDATELSASVGAIIPIVISAFAVVLVVSAIGGMMGKMNFGGSKGRGKKR